MKYACIVTFLLIAHTTQCMEQQTPGPIDDTKETLDEFHARLSKLTWEMVAVRDALNEAEAIVKEAQIAENTIRAGINKLHPRSTPSSRELTLCQSDPQHSKQVIELDGLLREQHCDAANLLISVVPRKNELAMRLQQIESERKNLIEMLKESSSPSISQRALDLLLSPFQ